MRTLEDAPFLDMLGPEFRADPAPIPDEMRRSWLVRTAMGGVVIDREQIRFKAR